MISQSNYIKKGAALWLLLDIGNIDYKATARSVKEFLDKKLPCILRLANGSPPSLVSPVISDMPVASDGSVNQSEKKMVRNH